MVLEAQQRGQKTESRADRQDSPSDSGEQLIPRRDELVKRLREALAATAFSNRFILPPRRLPQIAEAEADSFLSFLRTNDVGNVRAQGARRAEEGVGERAMLRLGASLRQFCSEHLAAEGLQAADLYSAALLEGFIEGREAILLREQEQIRRALQRVVSRYALQLVTAAEVSRAASGILDLQKLLREVVNLIRERFDFYYVGIFLLDELREYAVLRAGTGEAGRRMTEMGHKLEVGGKSMVGWCTAHSEARIALDVGREAVRFDNPLLPETRSELALPLISRGEVIGAMTIQSNHAAAFSKEDITALQIMADQLANAIENARLLRRTEESLEELSKLHQRYVREKWEEYLADEEERARVGYLYEGGHVIDASDAWMPEMALAVQRGETVAWSGTAVPPDRHTAETRTSTRSSPAQAALAVPLAVRGQVIGTLDFYDEERSRQWSSDDIALVEAVADQVALAIENARAYAEIQRTAEELKELDRLKSQFLANMSHELRTPLNSIIGFSRVILKGIDGPLTDTQRTDLQAVHESGQHLLGLINDILDISKIQAGKMELSFEDVDLYDIIKGVMSTALALVKGKPIELQQSIPPDLPIIRADGRRVRQVLLNLVGNAAKFTEEGFIRVEAEARTTEVVISITDSGIGIAPEKVKTIFEPFTQVDASTTRRAGGTGLGLSISRHFVEMHGGRIWVDSRRDKGSTFHVAFPVEAAPQPAGEKDLTPATRAAPASEYDYRLVLCVDDDEGVTTLFRRYLGKQGYQVVALADSTSVVEKARQLKPCAITLDIMMPNKDGCQVLQELKADPDTQDIPVIMCTIAREQKERSFSLGASDCLIKPILEGDLLSALQRLDGESAGTPVGVDSR